jgi:hypothetical protein
MNTTCGNCSCDQGRNCPLSAAAVRSRVLGYIICSIAAVALFVLIGASQALDSYDEQAAQSQVMACSEHQAYCKAWAEAHASTPANRR